MEVLGTVILDNNYLFIDYWSFIHLFFGVVLMFLIIKLSDDGEWHNFINLFLILFLWEIFEGMVEWIRPESFTDIFYDLMFGMLGGIIYWKLNKRKNEKQKETLK